MSTDIGSLGTVEPTHETRFEHLAGPEGPYPWTTRNFKFDNQDAGIVRLRSISSTQGRAKSRRTETFYISSWRIPKKLKQGTRYTEDYQLNFWQRFDPIRN